jgi:hypothetical protein
VSAVTVFSILPLDAEAWPFTRMDARPDAWVELTKEQFDYCLGVLPPIYFRGGFAISEASRHTAEGVPVYCCVVTIRGRRLARELTIAEAEATVPWMRAALGA